MKVQMKIVTVKRLYSMPFGKHNAAFPELKYKQPGMPNHRHNYWERCEAPEYRDQGDYNQDSFVVERPVWNDGPQADLPRNARPQAPIAQLGGRAALHAVAGGGVAREERKETVLDKAGEEDHACCLALYCELA